MNEFQKTQLRYVVNYGELRLQDAGGNLYARADIRAAADYLQGNGYVYTTQDGVLRPTEKGERAAVDGPGGGEGPRLPGGNPARE